MVRKLIYSLLFAGWYLFSLLPLFVLYQISDCLYYLITYIVRYRRRVIYGNLRTSFPEKTDEEIDRIAKGFYAFFCDYIVETVKLMSISENNIRKRMVFDGEDAIEAEFAKGKSVVLFLGHYCNWEWVSTIALHTQTQCGQIYHPLENPFFDQLFLYFRNRWGAKSIPMEETFLQMRQWKKEGITHMVGFIADQSPLLSSIHHFTDFLHHETPVLTGGERIARLLDCSAFYLDIECTRRGHYRARYVKIADDVKSLPTFELTDRYFALLEKSIQRAPQYWLWSHNRWKRMREHFNSAYSEEEREKRLSRL